MAGVGSPMKGNRVTPVESDEIQEAANSQPVSQPSGLKRFFSTGLVRAGRSSSAVEKKKASLVRQPTMTNSQMPAGSDSAAGNGPLSAHLIRKQSMTDEESALQIEKSEFTHNGAASEREGDESSAPDCLMSDGSWIFHPYSTPRLVWDIWIVVLLIYTSLMVPYALAFQDVVCNEETPEINYLDLIVLWSVDCFFWIDIILNFRTAIVDPQADNLVSLALITDWKKIMKSYLKGWFWLDLLGSFPVQVIESMLMANGECSLAALKALRLNRLARLSRLVKLVRLARLARWGRLITKARDAMSINPGHLRLVQFILVIFVLAHFIACLLYGLVYWEDDFAVNWATETSVVVPGEGLYTLKCPPFITVFNETLQEEVMAPESRTRFKAVVRGGRNMSIPECLSGDDYLEEAPPIVKYLVSLYVTFTTLTTVGYGDITMKTTPELAFGIVMMAVGASTFAVVIGNMAALLGKMDIRASAFKERMEDLDDFMHQENLPLDLRFRTRAFFEYRYNHSRDIPPSIEELSLSLRTEVALHLYNDLITTVPFFRHCGKEFLTDVILRLKAETLSPGDFLYEAGEYGDSMFFLIKGSVEVVLDDKHGVFAELKEGSYFGEHCVLGLAEHRPVSVRAMTWCNLFCLTQQSLEDSITAFPEAQEHFRKLAYEQSAEKTVTSAVKRMDRHKNPQAGSFDEGGDMDPSMATDAEGMVESMLVEPPVVTRALMRSRKKRGGADSSGASGFTRESSNDIRAESSSHLGDGIARVPTSGSEHPKTSPLHTERQNGSKAFAKDVMVNVQAAQKASHALRMQLRADLEKLYQQLQSIKDAP